MATNAVRSPNNATPLLTALALGLGAAGLGSGAAAAPSTGSLKQLSVEELMNVEVYSASRHLEPTQAAPTAIFVLTNDDLRRSHVTSIPEALRLVPGVEVGRVDANKWAVSMRGFNSREANKLLVLVDGRSVYDPLFSGMLWESQDIMLEDVDRIEVVRGPGGTLWGANAFNGVINIVTRNAQDTQGALVAASAGNEERYTVAGRYGWQISDHQFARVYAKVYDRDEGYATPVPAYDASRMARGGFRWDWSGESGDRLTLSGDIFDARSGIRETPTLVQDVDHAGRNVVARWNHVISSRNSIQVQAYYDHVDYESTGFDQHRNTFDLELQQNIQATTRHLLVWGAGLRDMRDDTSSGLPGLVDVLPLQRHDRLTNVFAQDTIALSPDKLALTLGVKYETTDYAPSEWLPNIRLAYTPNANQTWWASVGEATRVPSRLESDLTFFNVIRLGDNFRAEHVRAYEVGHRQLVSPQLWYDIAVFFNDYDHLRSSEAGGQLGNLMRGNSRGAELALRWEPSTAWRIDAAYTYLIMNLTLDPASTSNPGQLGYIQDLASRNQVSLRAAVDLADNLQLDATARYVDAVLSLGFPAYTELDLALTWTPRAGLDLSLVGQNLLHAHHPEQDFAFSASTGAEGQRGYYGRVVWHF